MTVYIFKKPVGRLEEFIREVALKEEAIDEYEKYEEARYVL